MGRPSLQLEGLTFGRVTVKRREGVDLYGHSLWMCICSCGKEVMLHAGRLKKGFPSCGCFRQAGENNPAFRHGHAGKPEYAAYLNAKRRCEDEQNDAYPEYGGRGIQFNFRSYEQLFMELGSRPSSSHSLDRIDNDGHYEPGNVRWATKRQQRINQRQRPPMREETKQKIRETLKRRAA